MNLECGPSAGYDVVVIGARCAGAATAMLLARGGLRVLAVDKARYGSDTLSTHALTRAGVLQLSRWGVLDDVRRAGTPPVSQVVYHYADEAVAVPVRPRGDVDGLYAPRRQILDRILVEAASRAGAEIRHRVAVRDLSFEDGRVVGVVLDEGGTTATVRAGIVVGADGARSLTARRVGARVEYLAPYSSATIYAYAGGLPDDAYHNYFRPGVSAGLIPTNANQANVWVGVPMRQLRTQRPADLFGRVLARAAPDLAADLAAALGRQPGGRLATFTGLPGFARRCWGPGWALVGDAAYFKDPISAHGMTDALIGAELLARAILAAAGGMPESTALATYAAERRELTAPMIPPIEKMASYGWDMAELRQAHLAMNTVMRAEWEHVVRLGDVPVATG